MTWEVDWEIKHTAIVYRNEEGNLVLSSDSNGDPEIIRIIGSDPPTVDELYDLFYAEGLE